MKRKVLVFILATALILGLSIGLRAEKAAADEVYTNNILNSVVTSSDGFCNLRTGPGLGYGVITPIYNGTSLRITAVTKNYAEDIVWGQTIYNGMSGWVSVIPTTVSDIENASLAVYDVTVSNENNIVLRRGPGTEYDELARPKNGQVLRIDRTIVNSWDGRPWGRTVYNGMQGWVSLNWTYRNSSTTYNQAQNVTFYSNIYNAVVGASDGFVNLRSGPGLQYPIITPIYNGNMLRVTAVMDSTTDGLVWGQTIYNGYSGWFSIDQTTITSIENAGNAQYTVTVSNSPNIHLRKGPGTEYDQLVSYIGNGTVLTITQTVINSFDGRPWGRTIVNGISGWVSLNWTTRN